jgi:hypothetical protein
VRASAANTCEYIFIIILSGEALNVKRFRVGVVVIAMPQSPLEDIHSDMKVDFVIRGGIVAKTPGGMK